MNKLSRSAWPILPLVITTVIGGQEDPSIMNLPSSLSQVFRGLGLDGQGDLPVLEPADRRLRPRLGPHHRPQPHTPADQEEEHRGRPQVSTAIIMATLIF